MQRLARKNRRSLTFQMLEARLARAVATEVVHSYREDDFALSGGYTYIARLPDEFDYIDTIDNGRYSTSEAHFKWTSPTAGTGYFVGSATGDGRDTVNFAGRRTCSEYGIEESGRLEFTLDAAAGTYRVTSSRRTAARHTYYRDMTGGFCEAPSSPYQRFFGGLSRNYSGTFSPATHQFSLLYDRGTPELKVTVPASPVQWTNQTATDLLVSAQGLGAIATIPDDFVPVIFDEEPPGAIPFVARHGGAVTITAEVQGKVLSTSTPQTPIAQIQLFWVTSPTDSLGTEITVSSTGNPLGLFWNSTQVRATIRELPDAPAGAQFLRVALKAPGITDAVAANSVFHLPLGEFQARDHVLPQVSEDGYLDGASDSVLHPLDRQADIEVLAYRMQTARNGAFGVTDPSGAYTYYPHYETSQPLADGETVHDFAEILVRKQGGLVDRATVTIPLIGRNDPPFPEVDSFATTNYQPVVWTAAQLLANDIDFDHLDVMSVQSVSASSTYGADVQIFRSADNSRIERIEYHPEQSAVLRSLGPGDRLDDYLQYSVADRLGLTGEAGILIQITGEERRLRVHPPGHQYALLEAPTTPFSVLVEDTDGDAADVELTVSVTDPTAGSLAQVEVVPSSSYFTVTITPGTGVTGHLPIRMTARNADQLTASADFILVVGTADDPDADGVPSAIEDAAPDSGDWNRDGVLDSQQGHVVSWLPAGGTSYLNLTVPAAQLLRGMGEVTSSTPADPAGEAPVAGAMVPIAGEILAVTPGQSVLVVVRAEDGTTPLNRLYQQTTGGWQSLMYNKRDGARRYHDRFEALLRDGGRADQDGQANGLLVAHLALGHVTRPWQNLTREDIDNDGNVVPIDVLVLINQLNERGPRSLGLIPAIGDVLPTFLDPSGNGSLEPIDALIVINYLNQRAAGGEGEALPLLSPVVDHLASTASVENVTLFSNVGQGRQIRSPLRWDAPPVRPGEGTPPDLDGESPPAGREKMAISLIDWLWGQEAGWDPLLSPDVLP